MLLKAITIYIIILVGQLSLSEANRKIIIENTDFSKRIEKKVTRIAKEKNIPSLEVQISRNEDVTHFQYHHKKVEKQDVYGIGSTTKLLSSVLIFKLIEDEKLRLNDKITEHFKLEPTITGIEKITVKHLLNHTSGLSDYTKNPEWIKAVMNANAPDIFGDKLKLVNDSLNNYGSFSYSNTNYLFLQKIVENLTGHTYEDYFNTFYSTNGFPGIKTGYDENGLQAFFGQNDQAVSNVSDWREHYGFDGGAYSDTKALDRFLIKLFKDKSILKPVTLSKMYDWINMESMSIPIGSGKISEYGNGIMKLTYEGQEYVGHFGSTLKYQSMVFYNSANNISISVVTNCSGPYFNKVFFQELIPAILDEL